MFDKNTIETRKARLAMEEQSRPAQSPRAGKSLKETKESLYAHIKVSVRTMDIIILVLAALILVCIVVGIVLGGGQK